MELEKLNSSTNEINRLEVDLDVSSSGFIEADELRDQALNHLIFVLVLFMLQDARAKFRQLLCDTTLQIDALGKKLGSCVERARPYYEARMKSKEVVNAHPDVFPVSYDYFFSNWENFISGID